MFQPTWATIKELQVGTKTNSDTILHVLTKDFRTNKYKNTKMLNWPIIYFILSTFHIFVFLHT